MREIVRTISKDEIKELRSSDKELGKDKVGGFIFNRSVEVIFERLINLFFNFG